MSAVPGPGGWYVVAWHYPGRPPIWGISRDEHGQGAEFLKDDAGQKRTFESEAKALEAITAAKDTA